ncbi:MAG: hypothetical protein HY650_11345, partial [Acidobacteria bacterium]|nr:hypothetical protein [Acidobacteriota bacterium]
MKDDTSMEECFAHQRVFKVFKTERGEEKTMKESRRHFVRKLSGLFGAASGVFLARGTAAAAPTNVWSSGNDRITHDDATKTYQFIIDGNARMDITQDGNNGVIALNGHGMIRSNGDVRIHLDENQADAPTEAAFKVMNGNDNTVFIVNERGEVDMHQGAILSRIGTQDANTGYDDFFIVATGLNRRGRVEIRHQPEIAGEFAQPRKAGMLVLYDEGGRQNYLWVDSTGELRISRSDPGANELSGT